MYTQKVDYQDDSTVLQAYVAYEEKDLIKPRHNSPVVLIAHAWCGRDSFVEEKARSLAKLGYIGCAIDVYGKGVLGDCPETNRTLMQPLMEDRKMLLRRLIAGLEVAKKIEMANNNKIAAIGYCFGGLCVLDLARSGADLRGVVSFHGLLQASRAILAKNMRAKVLALHGYEDPMVPPDVMLEFAKEMTDAKAEWQLHIFGKTMHAFTDPKANNSNMGTVYSLRADKYSWTEAVQFLEEVFK
ncbi:dienelactone hydrolase family protein [Coxiella endosymbiont of Amblyomma americanum]|uniref:dienelactone hydrolase family protein n=1 Tax=Coxiella endosymbiont of Amblyomma americanum TaxID=325775 RepID=UPI00057EAA8D|nr:dienelactone hydrolase family protein [Coxiella endosymbiont of Amblyomma americanum]AJC50593.1 carboxymethylenebutenolidase [Coxiella endosymbiont of Amblyomma americanum]